MRTGWMMGLLAGIAPGTLYAHPSHGLSDASSWLHYLSEPIHIVLLLGVALLAVPVLRRALSAESAGRRS